MCHDSFDKVGEAIRALVDSTPGVIVTTPGEIKELLKQQYPFIEQSAIDKYPVALPAKRLSSRPIGVNDGSVVVIYDTKKYAQVGKIPDEYLKPSPDALEVLRDHGVKRLVAV